MANKLKTQEIFRKDFVLQAANNVKVDVGSDVMPAGLLRGFWVTIYSAAITGFGSAVADYQKILATATWGANGFPKYNVATAISGKLLDAITTTMRRRALPRTTPAAGGFKVKYYLPYAYPGTDRRPAYRTKDTALLNVGNKALPFITLQLGPYVNLSAAASACTATVVVECDFDPLVRPGLENADNPALSGDQPGRALQFLQDSKADLAVVCNKLFVSAPGTECIGVFARELDNTGAEVSDIFKTGPATPSKYEFKKGDSDSWNADQKVDMLDDRADAEFGIAPQAGYHYWLAARNGHLRDNVPLGDSAAFRLWMDNLNTTANRVLETVQINTVDLPKETIAAQAAQLGAVPVAAAPTK